MEVIVFLFLNALKIYQFKAKDSEIKPFHYVYIIFQKIYSQWYEKKTGLRGIVEVFYVDYNPITWLANN